MYPLKYILLLVVIAVNIYNWIIVQVLFKLHLIN
jgi:hypothetical protein